ncbi:MAG TPA: hypothetical protein VGD99_24035 [Anaerolineae bacterium]|jgi:hypothetical protein
MCLLPIARTTMNSSCYQTAPNELGFEMIFSPIYRALCCSRVTSSPGERGQHSHAGYWFIFLISITRPMIGLQFQNCNHHEHIT